MVHDCSAVLLPASFASRDTSPSKIIPRISRVRSGGFLGTHIPSDDNDVLVSAITATQSRTSFSASLGTTKDARKIGKNLFPVHRKATISPSAASKV